MFNTFPTSSTIYPQIIIPDQAEEEGSWKVLTRLVTGKHMCPRIYGWSLLTPTCDDTSDFTIKSILPKYKYKNQINK